MFWSSFCSKAVGPLVAIQGTMNSEKYVAVLNNYLKEQMMDWGTEIFQDDSAPCHRAKSVKNWMHSEKIETLEWPGNSPDLNPIENLWGIVKRKLRQRVINNKADLIRWTNFEWMNIPVEILEKLIHSMQKQLAKSSNVKEEC